MKESYDDFYDYSSESMINKRDIFSLNSLEVLNEITGMYTYDEKLKILDVGCGSGYTVNYLSERGFDVTGIDFYEEVINEGKKRYKYINIKVMDANNIDFPRNTFDIILFECSLSVMQNQKNILNDSKKLLKKDGLILLSDFFLKNTSIEDGTYTLNYWNKLFADLDFQVITFQDKSREWRNYLGMVLWEYGELSVLLRGNQNCNLKNDIFKKETGYFFVLLRKKD